MSKELFQSEGFRREQDSLDQNTDLRMVHLPIHLFTLMEREIIPFFYAVHQSMVTEDIAIFCGKLKEFSVRYNLGFLERFAQNLEMHLRNFSVEEMENYLDIFDGFIRNHTRGKIDGKKISEKNP